MKKEKKVSTNKKNKKEDISAVIIRTEDVPDISNNNEIPAGNIVNIKNIQPPSNPFSDVQLWDQLHELDKERYKDLTYTSEELRKIKLGIKRMSTGVFSSLPMLCNGTACPQATECPLIPINKYPLFKKCVIEINIMEELYKRYLFQFDVKENEYTKISIIDDLITVEIMLRRALNSVSDPNLRARYYKNVKGFTDTEMPFVEYQDGLIITTTEEEAGTNYDIKPHPGLEVIERLMNRKQKLLTILVGTPQEEYKRSVALGDISRDDSSKELSKIREDLNKILENKKLEDLQKKYLE